MMRENFWHDILSIRRTVAGVLRTSGEQTGLTTAVPRFRKRVVAAGFRRERPVVTSVSLRRSVSQKGPEARIQAAVRKAASGALAELPVRRQHSAMDTVFPRRRSVAPVVSVVTRRHAKTGQGDAHSGVRRVARQSSLSGVGVNAIRMKRPVVVEGRSATGKGAPVPEGGVSSRLLGRLQPVTVGKERVRQVGDASGRSLWVPPVRRQEAGEASMTRAGRAVGQDVSDAQSWREKDNPADELERGVVRTDFSSTDRNRRLSARRSGGGIDEIMQPQYPGRSIGFF